LPAVSTAAPDVAVARLTIAPGAGPAFAPFTVSLSPVGGQLVASISGVPEGPGRTFTVEALDAAGTLVANGSTAADIVAGLHATVVIVLNEVAPTSGPVVSAPIIDRLTLTSDTVAPLGSVDLTVSAHDVLGNALPVLWSATCGAFAGDPALDGVTWIAPAAPTTCRIAVTASGDGAQVTAVVPITVAP
jgi:hypothetical protein